MTTQEWRQLDAMLRANDHRWPTQAQMNAMANVRSLAWEQAVATWEPPRQPPWFVRFFRRCLTELRSAVAG